MINILQILQGIYKPTTPLYNDCSPSVARQFVSLDMMMFAMGSVSGARGLYKHPKLTENIPTTQTDSGKLMFRTMIPSHCFIYCLIEHRFTCIQPEKLQGHKIHSKHKRFGSNKDNKSKP